MEKKYNIKLNKDRLKWGSVVPDIFPKYKFQRHYIQDSLHFISNEIATLIFVSRFINFDKNVNSFAIRLFSRKLGIISHYLSDFCCTAHAKNWSFDSNMIKHIKYEKAIDEFVVNHEFKEIELKVEEIDIYGEEVLKLRYLVSEQIKAVIAEYEEYDDSIENDLNFAHTLNIRISSFILEMIFAMQEEKKPLKAILAY